MKVQIYTLQSVDEAQKVASLGVDLVGVTPANIGLPGEITLEMGKDIYKIQYNLDHSSPYYFFSRVDFFYL